MRGRLQIGVLGELMVALDGKPVPLPASKKTRALLAYLAVVGRPLRRDHLCELLWEAPDDPRAALRWSLHKIRRIANGDGQERLTADNSRAFLDPEMIELDFRRISRLRLNDLDALSTTDLQSLVDIRAAISRRSVFATLSQIRSVAGSPRRCRGVSSDSRPSHLGESDERTIGAFRRLCSAERCWPAARQRASCRVGRV
jgi:hypothetical protein